MPTSTLTDIQRERWELLRKAIDGDAASVDAVFAIAQPSGYPATAVPNIYTDIDTAQTNITALLTDSTSAQAMIDIPITSWTNGGAPLVAFGDGSADGLALVDSEVVGIRFNDTGGTRAVLAVTVPMPQDLDDSAAVVFHALGFRVGAADATMVLTVGAFFQTVAAAHTADATCGGSTTAFDGATTVVTEETLSIAAADVPAAPCALTLTVTPDAALDGDDFVLVATWLEYTRKALTA